MINLLFFYRRLAADRRGVAAVEFALILPFMALIYFGAIEVSQLVSADRKVTQTASALADLVARTDRMSTSEMDDVFEASRTMFEPFDATAVKMRVSSVIDDQGVARVAWSKGKNVAPLSAGDPVTLQAGVLPAKGSVVMAEVSYPFNSLLGLVLKDGVVLNDTFYLRPRLSDKVDWQ